MAKGQLRSNKEAKKPKQAKKPAPGPSSSVGQRRQSARGGQEEVAGASARLVPQPGSAQVSAQPGSTQSQFPVWFGASMFPGLLGQV